MLHLLQVVTYSVTYNTGDTSSLCSTSPSRTATANSDYTIAKPTLQLEVVSHVIGTTP